MLVHFIKAFDFSLLAVLLCFGLGIFLLRQRSRAAKQLLVAGFVLLLFFSNRVPINAFLFQLETRYPPLLSPTQVNNPQTIHSIVVLGSSARPNSPPPISSQTSGVMLTRLAEGIRLLRQFPNARLILSGGGSGATSDARMMEQAAISLGVDTDKLILEEQSLTTHEEALQLQHFLGRDPFLLVTSARHMPRAMALFQKQGMTPIPAPTDYLSDTPHPVSFEDMIPHAGRLHLWTSLIYEYLATVKAKFDGHL